MKRYTLRDDQWEKIRDLLPGRPETVGVTANNNRLFVEAVLFRYRAGIPWRDLPERFGDWQNIYNRYNRWPCATHRDFRPGNLIVHDGKLTGVIDWADARASFAEADFCLIDHGDWLKEHKNTFLSGYASIRQLTDYKPLIPFLHLNKAIVTIGFLVKRGTWETTDKRLYQFNRQFLDDLLEGKYE